MKKIFLVLVITLFFSACSFEQDTRLVCDCYLSDDSTDCEYKKNIPLVFNESQQKFTFDGFDLTTFPRLKELLRFSENYISTCRYKVDMWR